MFRILAMRLSLGLLLLSVVFFGAGCVAGSAAPLLFSLILAGSGLALVGCGESHAPVGDAAPDVAGDWEPCCVGGMVDTCFCPATDACNYGWFEDCGEGTCVDLGVMCPGVDGGSPDASDAGSPDAADTAPVDDGGTWEPCCNAGVVDTCWCPPATECNYGLYTDCGDGLCVDPLGTCPGVDAGTPVDAGAPADAG